MKYVRSDLALVRLKAQTTSARSTVTTGEGWQVEREQTSSKFQSKNSGIGRCLGDGVKVPGASQIVWRLVV